MTAHTAMTPPSRFAALAAALGWIALALQLVLSVRLALDAGRSALWGVFMYFGYFTILTNLLVACALTAAALRQGGRFWRFFRDPGVVSAIATSIAIVGLVYFGVLRFIWKPEGWLWLADVLLHYVMPTLFLIYWWLNVPTRGLHWRRLPRWWIYPLAYLGYALVRGAIAGVYPYPFIDVGAIGWTHAALNSLGVWLGFSSIALVLMAVGRIKPIPKK